MAGRNFVQLGLRGYWPEKDTFDWMDEQGLRWHRMVEIEERGAEAVIADAIVEALDGPDCIYLSIDVDVVDPGSAPGTGTPEPGGMLPRELLRAVRQVVSAVDLVGMDVVRGFAAVRLVRRHRRARAPVRARGDQRPRREEAERRIARPRVHRRGTFARMCRSIKRLREGDVPVSREEMREGRVAVRPQGERVPASPPSATPRRSIRRWTRSRRRRAGCSRPSRGKAERDPTRSVPRRHAEDGRGRSRVRDRLHPRARGGRPRPTWRGRSRAALTRRAGPPEEGGSFDVAFSEFREAAARAYETAGPGYLPYVPGGGLFTSALAQFLYDDREPVPEPLGGAPGLVQIEQNVIRWLCDLFSYPAESARHPHDRRLDGEPLRDRDGPPHEARRGLRGTAPTT